MVDNELKNFKVTTTLFEFSSYKFEPGEKRIFFSYKIAFDDRPVLEFT